MKKPFLVFFLAFTFLLVGFGTFAEENVAVEYIDYIRNSYQVISRENDYLFRVGNNLESTYHERNVISADLVLDAYTSYDFDMMIDGTSEFALQTYFSMNSENFEDRSYIIYCKNDLVSAKIIKELILATLYVVEEDISDDEAQSALKQIVNTFDGKSHSNVYSNDDYYVFVSYYESYTGDSSTKINVVDKHRLYLSDVEKRNYANMTYSEICAPLNALELVSFEGIPVKCINHEPSDWSEINREYWQVQLTDGLVRVMYDFDSYPFYLELDKLYIFYGVIVGGDSAGTGTIRLDSLEIVE